MKYSDWVEKQWNDPEVVEAHNRLRFRFAIENYIIRIRIATKQFFADLKKKEVGKNPRNEELK